MRWIKRLLALLTLGLVLYLFWPLLDEIQAAAFLFRRAQWEWLAAAIVAQVISYASLTWLNYLALQPFSGKIGFFKLSGILTAMAFIEIAIPSAGASGVALRTRLLGKHGHYTVEVSAFSLMIETIYEAIAVASVAIFGLVYLLRSGRLTITEIGWFSVASLGLVSLAVGGWSLVKDRQLSHRLLAKLASWWNRLAGRYRPVDMEFVDQRLDLFQAGLAQLSQAPRWKFWLAAYGKVILDVATLGACFLLFDYPITAGRLLTGYGLVLLLSGLASLPGGLGVADVTVPVIFARVGLPGSVALAAGLTYRLIAYWLLRFIGFIYWQVLEEK